MGIGYQASQILCKYYKDNRILPNNAKCIMLGRHNIDIRTQNQKNIINSFFPNIAIDSLSGYAEQFFENIA